MPSRKPIIPRTSGSGQLLKALHVEMRQRTIFRDNTSTSSGIHSNSDVSEQSDPNKTRNPELLKSNLITQRPKMGKSRAKKTDVIYGDEAEENKNESDSSGPDDDGDDDDNDDDVTDDDEGDRDNVNFDGDNDSDDSDTDGDRYEKEKGIRVNEDIAAWEHARPVVRNRYDVRNQYTGGQKFIQQYSGQSTAIAGTRTNATDRQTSAPTSYVRLVKETEDEIELIRRKHGARVRHGKNSQQLDPEQRKELMSKRRSTNSITFLYGRRKDHRDANPNATTEISRRNSLDAATKKQMRERAITMNSRDREVSDHLHQLQGGRMMFQPIKTPRSQNKAIPNTSRALVPASKDLVPRPAPRSFPNGYNSDDSELIFPLRDMAAGESEHPLEMRKAKTLETAAKRRAKALKNDVGIARLDVAEARSSEFSATLRARQAKIEERQAKLCRRRAALKLAEEEQDALEAKMDGEEEDHRARERRIKNRERRVRQEEAGLRLKEESLRKREVAITHGIEQLERRRKLVEEKEDMQKSMEDIMQKKEELHGRDMSRSVQKTGFFGKMLKKNSEKQPAPSDYPTPHIRTTKSGIQLSSSYDVDITETQRTNSHHNNNTPRRSLPNTNNITAKPRKDSESKDGKTKLMGLWI
ncbi:uncharacterized protein LOC120340826 [Styela clava]